MAKVKTSKIVEDVVADALLNKYETNKFTKGDTVFTVESRRAPDVLDRPLLLMNVSLEWKEDISLGNNAGIEEEARKGRPVYASRHFSELCADLSNTERVAILKQRVAEFVALAGITATDDFDTV